MKKKKYKKFRSEKRLLAFVLASSRPLRFLELGSHAWEHFTARNTGTHTVLRDRDSP